MSLWRYWRIAMAGESKKPLLLTEQQMEDVIEAPFASGTAVAFSARCPGKDGPNEDAAALIPIGPGQGILVVADGLGGQPSGERAASVAVRELESSLARAPADGTDLRNAILDGIESANRGILELGVGAGTTLSIVEIQEQWIRPYHVGDSMILVTGGRGRVKLQTVPHSPLGYAQESGLLEEAEALHHEERHLVSNIVGASDMRIEIGPRRKLAPRDTTLLATDGLGDNLDLETIVSLVRQRSLTQVVGDLADLCLSRMKDPAEGHPSKPDDVTLIAFRPGGSP